MISLTFVFYLFVIITGVIGLMRGWAKELLVVFSAILALFIISIFQRYVGIFQEVVDGEGAREQRRREDGGNLDLGESAPRIVNRRVGAVEIDRGLAGGSEAQEHDRCRKLCSPP